jgi:Fe(II)/alpha-ketoglutarate-dependent arginine beta-hydroxylase
MRDHAFSPAEADDLRALSQEVLADMGSPAAAPFYAGLQRHLPRVPAGLRAVVTSFRDDDRVSALRISGLQVDPDRCGPTPSSWQEALDDNGQELEEAQLALVAAQLGRPFSWPTIQNGRMVQNLMPVKAEREAQSGHGSVTLEWHTEDGFHEDRCRYLLLLGIRNPDRIPTTIGDVHDVRLTDRHREVLRERRFHIRPDPEHLRQLAEFAPDSAALRRAREMHARPDPVSILFGSAEAPFLRLDAPYTSAVPGDAEAEEALKAIVTELDQAQEDVVVGEGDLLIVDNYRAVHGRRAFAPRFDGTDRWLKRISVS